VQIYANTVIFPTVFARGSTEFCEGLCALSGNDKESFNPILDPDAYPDHHHNLLTTSRLGKI